MTLVTKKIPEYYGGKRVGPGELPHVQNLGVSSSYIFGGKSQTSISRNALGPGAKKDGCFRRLRGCEIKDHKQLNGAVCVFDLVVYT